MRQLGLFAACALGVACGPTDSPTVATVNVPPTYAGAAACSSCHEFEFDLWQKSHHARAMQHATADTVLGDFSDVEFQHFDTTTAFYEREGGFYVRTDNADGELQEFRVAYTFGLQPLQQYLIEFPGGRLQALPIAWDARSVEEGGQRWFHLYPSEPITHDDVLHWTGREQNWNYMCAECHSTNLARNYDLESDSFDTKWSEINVSCEACHGPASEHVGQAKAGAFAGRYGLLTDLDDTGRAVWEMNADSGIAARSEPRMRPPIQPEACGRCHSRRSVISTEYGFGKSLLDTHLPVLLDDTLYYPDGQIRDEVYVYGSFLQSRMYQAGVSCSDCHEPHSGRLHTGPDPDEICASCHSPARFASAAHDHHPVGSAGCVDCHMASRNYMGVDGRRDHSFRIPRPDIALATGSPDACRQCHDDRTSDWAVTRIEEWYGAKDATDHFGFAIDAARTGKAGANGLLAAAIKDRSVPGIAKGTALTELQSPFSQEIGQLVRASLTDSDPFARIGALRALPGVQPQWQVEWASPLLQDRLLAVRIEAARILSPYRRNLDDRYREAFTNAERELVGAMLAIADRPEAHVSLAKNYVDAGDINLALSEYQIALRLDPGNVSARVNLADLYRQLDRDPDADTVLREGIGLEPRNASLHHSLGLLLVRGGREEEGLDELRLAAGQDEGNARFLYVYAVALNSLGQPAAALDLLARGIELFPADFDIHWALATMLRDQGKEDAARTIAKALAERYPGVAPVQELLHTL
jgi:Tfp pilus assembly protein PilF